MSSRRDWIRYGVRNWRIVRESARLKMRAPSPAQTTVDDFHTLLYETAYANGDSWNPRWLGYPTLKCPFDLWTYQEIVFEIRPELIIETGTARGGSALFLASMLDLVGGGRVVSVDIVRRAEWPVHPRITYVTGSSTSESVAAAVADHAREARRVLVILDSDHKKDHVAAELRLYAPLVTRGSYLIVEDTNINGHPVFTGFGPGPAEAVSEFLERNPQFARDRRRERFFVSFNPGGYLKREN